MPATSDAESFTIVVGDKHSEVPLTLNEPVPQVLGLFDQFGLWGNLGVSLLGFTGAIFVLQPGGTGTPELSLVAGLSAIVLGYLFVELVRHRLPAFDHGTWSGYWAATDTVVAAAVSFAPLAADYTRHSRSERTAFWGTFVGYSVTQILCYIIGLLALVTVARNPSNIYGAFIAVPLGSICFALLATRELDQSFANVYSTAVSIQNFRPLLDRRVLALSIASLATVLALWTNVADYENFLVLLGSVFVPMSAVFIVDFFVLSHGHWNLSLRAPKRVAMLVPWSMGFITYQLINPGYISWWVSLWMNVGRLIDFRAASWMSASLCSFFVSSAVTLAGGGSGSKFEWHRLRKASP